MTTPIPFKVKLSDGQKRKLKKAIQSNSPINLKVDKSGGPDQLMLTQTQINKIQKSPRSAIVKISQSNIGQQGGSLLGAVMKLAPYATKAAAKIAPPLATGALSALSSLGIDKIFGKGMYGGAIPDTIMKMIQKGIEVPVKFLVNLINLDEMLTKAQRTLVGKGIQSGRGILFKPTRRQIEGGLLGTLAAIGIPMAIELASKLFGKGLIPPRKKGWGMHVPPSGLMPFRPPPIYGNWPVHGEGKKKISRKRTVAGRQYSIEKHSTSKHTTVKPKGLRWKDVPLSNFDLEEWVRWLKIPEFAGTFSRDDVNHTHVSGCCIINLDDGVGNGTHWVATKVQGNTVLYFDSFCMPPEEFVAYAKKLGKAWIYNGGHPIQDLNSVRCGWYCLYFLDNIWKKSFYDVLAVFDLNDPMQNEEFIKEYFTEKMKSYCVKERKQTECVEPSGTFLAKNGRPMFFCTCASCGVRKTRFIKKKGN